MKNYYLKRLLAFAIDYLIAYTVYFITSATLFGVNPFIVFILAFANSMIVITIEVLYLFDGQTLGKRIFALKVQGVDKYQLKNSQIIAREFSKYFLLFNSFIIISLINLFWVMVTPQKQALHDYICKSILVQVKTSNLTKEEMHEGSFTKSSSSSRN